MPRGPRAQHELYSPERPTAVVLGGTGVDGAYHAGVLKALRESGVKVDLVAGRGVGAVAALLFALDGAAALWEPRGLWQRPATRPRYRVSWRLRVLAWTLGGLGAIVASPALLLAAAVVVWPLSLVVGWLGLDGGAPLALRYVDWLGWLFAPDRLPAWMARLTLATLLPALAALALAAGLDARRDRRRRRGTWLWRLLGAPVDSAGFAATAMSALWDLLRGGAALARPPAAEISQRLTELLVAGAGQPGHRDVLLTVHDLDARRDVVFGLISGDAGRRLFPGGAGPAARRAEAFDLAGLGRASLIDVLTAAVTLPDLSEPHVLAYPADSAWRGESHRVADRPAALARLLEESASAGMEQAIIVTAAPEPGGPHALTPPRLDPQSRVSDWLAAQEAAAVRDAIRFAQAHFHAVFVIRPSHNPLTPLDTDGAEDVSSARFVGPADLLARGVDDAHRLFIEPALGAAGERVVADARGHA